MPIMIDVRRKKIVFVFKKNWKPYRFFMSHFTVFVGDGTRVDTPVIIRLAY